MDDGIQFQEAFRVVEYERGKAPAIDHALVVQNFLTEFVHHGIVSFATRKQHPMSQVIGADQMAAEIREPLAHERLAAGQAAGQADTEHKRRSAASTVLDMSMAIVSGPT